MKILRELLFIIIIILVFTNISFSLDTDYYWQDIFQNNGSVMLIINPETGEIISANSAAENFYGYKADKLKSMNIDEINLLDGNDLKEEMNKAIEENRNYFEFDHKMSDGSIRHVEVYSYPTETIDGQNLLFSIIHDVTEKMQLEKENHRNRMTTIVLLIIILSTLIALIVNIEKSKATLKKERNLFKTTLHSIGDGVISVSSNGLINFINKEAESLIGLYNEEVSGKKLSDIFKIIDSYENRISDLISDSKKMESDERFLLRKDGNKIPIDYNISDTISEIGNIDGFVIAFRDYTYKKEKQDEIIYLSYHDQLTGLNNRRFFEEKMIELDTEENLPLTIAMIDVNGLKLTNDAFGHSTGDKLLKKLLKHLLKTVLIRN